MIRPDTVLKPDQRHIGACEPSVTGEDMQLLRGRWSFLPSRGTAAVDCRYAEARLGFGQRRFFPLKLVIMVRSARCALGILFLMGGVLSGCMQADPTEANVEPPSSHLDSLRAIASLAPEEEATVRLVRSQTLYVPAYSHIYVRDAQRSINLATTLSLRNTSPEASIVLSEIAYYDSHGDRVRAYLDTSRVLDPLASTYVVVDVDDIRRGVGANFMVRWHADTPVSPPVVETVMITTESTLGISFRSTARVLHENRVEEAPADSAGDVAPRR